MRDPGRAPTPDDPVSLHGLDPLEALRALLAVDPDSDPVEDEDRADVSRNDDEAPVD